MVGKLGSPATICAQSGGPALSRGAEKTEWCEAAGVPRVYFFEAMVIVPDLATFGPIRHLQPASKNLYVV